MNMTRLLQEKWNALNPLYKKYLRCLPPILLLSFSIPMLFSFFTQETKLATLITELEHKQATTISAQISGIRTQIDKLTATQNTTQAEHLDNALVEIEKNVTDVAKSSELQKIASEIKTQLDNLEKSMSTSSHAKQYLDVKALPFQVLSIDVISQQAFVSVDYAHQITALQTGDSLAGWKVIRADYSAVEVEFENNQGQYVKVSVPEI
jgi:hypothetical protein